MSRGTVPHPEGQRAEQVGGALEGRTRRGTGTARITAAHGTPALTGRRPAGEVRTRQRRPHLCLARPRPYLPAAIKARPHHLVTHGARWTRRKGEPRGSGETLHPPQTLPPGSSASFQPDKPPEAAFITLRPLGLKYCNLGWLLQTQFPHF